MTNLLWLFGLLSYSSDNDGDMRLAFEFFFKHFVFNSSDSLKHSQSFSSIFSRFSRKYVLSLKFERFGTSFICFKN